MSQMASRITSLMIVYSSVYSGTYQSDHQSSASLAFVGEFTGDRWILRGNSPVTGEFSAQRASNAGNVSIWWRHHMEIVSQKSVTRGFDVYFRLLLNKRLSKQSRRRWFETPSRSLWRNNYGIHVVHLPNLWGLLHWPQCQWIDLNSLRPSDVYTFVNLASLVQIMACRLVGAKPLSELISGLC